MNKGLAFALSLLLCAAARAEVKCQSVVDKEIKAMGLGSGFDHPDTCTAKAPTDGGVKILSTQGSTSVEVTSMDPLPNGATGKITIKRKNLSGAEESKLVYVMPDCKIREVVYDPGTNNGSIVADASSCDEIEWITRSREGVWGEEGKTKSSTPAPKSIMPFQLGLANQLCGQYKGTFSTAVTNDQSKPGGIGSRKGTSGR